MEGNKKIFVASIIHPLLGDLHNILLKYTGIYQVIENVLNHLSGLQKAQLMGDFARGNDSSIIDLMIVGKRINLENLLGYFGKVVRLIDRKIHYQQLSFEEAGQMEKYYPKRLL